jgi:hypothetical protein
VISKTGIHALAALAVLAKLSNGSYAGAGVIAKAIDAPPNYLGKLRRCSPSPFFVPESDTRMRFVEPLAVHIG